MYEMAALGRKKNEGSERQCVLLYSRTLGKLSLGTTSNFATTISFYPSSFHAYTPRCQSNFSLFLVV
jgi:hypothetical protein